jgi:2'-hydroxyisoflavone reductase
VAAGVGGPVELTWVPQEFLLAQDVRPWAGERSLPLWLPLPDYGGFLTRDVTSSFDAGLTTRDVSDTARATLSWLRGASEQPAGAGLTRDHEAAVLSGWRASDFGE